MARNAKHLATALAEGVEAGMEAYMSAPISKQYPLYAEINRKRTQQGKLAAYCNAFNLDRDTTPAESNDTAAIVAAVIAALGMTTPQKPAPSTTTSKPRTRKMKASTGTITAGDAWKALGGGEDFKPSDPSKPANNGQLWRMNTQGLLKIA